MLLDKELIENNNIMSEMSLNWLDEMLKTNIFNVTGIWGCGKYNGKNVSISQDIMTLCFNSKKMNAKTGWFGYFSKKQFKIKGICYASRQYGQFYLLWWGPTKWNHLDLRYFEKRWWLCYTTYKFKQVLFYAKSL